MTWRTRLPAAAAALATLAATALAVPRIWLEPLHVDELVTLSVAPHAFGRTIDEIFVEKGGAPLHFFVERATLTWPGGLLGLRGPSVVFLLLALPAVFLLARDLLGEREAALATALTALAPLASDLAAFGRMYMLFLALLAWGTWYAFARADAGRREWAIAGAVLGVLVYVHPIAPLYGGVALGAAALHARLPLRRLISRASTAAPAFVVVGLPFYAHALPRLRERYYVGYRSSERLTGTHGRSVPEDIVDALTPLGGIVAIGFGVLVVIGLAALLARAPRTGLAVAFAVAVPVAFFSLVTAGEPGPGGARFFVRYVLPLVPWVALLVTAGCAATARAARIPAIFAVLAIAACGAQAVDDYRALDRLQTYDLIGAVEAVNQDSRPTIVFSASGLPLEGRPADLLDELVALEVEDAEHVREERVQELTQYERRCGRGAGAWILAGTAATVDAAADRLDQEERVAVAFSSPRLLVFTSARTGTATDLLRDGVVIRQAWLETHPRDRRTRLLLHADKRALSAAICAESRR